MSGKKVDCDTNVKKVDINESVICALGTGDSGSLINLVRTHGLTYCGASYGGYALLRDAITSGHYDIAEFLLQEGTRVDCETDRVSSLLHHATEKGWADFVHLLLEKNAPVDARNGQNETPLHLAVKNGFSNIVKVLLKSNASLTAQTDEGSTPLLLAVEFIREEIVGMLLKHARTNVKDEQNNGSSISMAEDRNSTLLDRILLRSPSARLKVNKLLVVIACHNNGRSKIVDDLIDHGFVLSREYVNESLLIAAIQNSHTKLIENILQSGVDLNDAKYNRLLLQIAVKYGQKEIVKLLLKSGLDVNAQDEFCKTPICYTLQYRDENKCTEVMKLLLSHGADLKKTPELLHGAVREGLFEVCKVLVENGALIDALDRNGDTPLHVSFQKKKANKAPQKKLKIKKQTDETTRGKIIKLLLSNHADVNVKAGDGLAAFHRAVESGEKEAVCIFLDFGIDVNLQAKDNATPLHMASVAGRKDILELLLINKANLNACLQNGATPLHLAAKYGHNQIVKILCEKGANMEAPQRNGWTPLHLAAIGRHTNVLMTLLNGGVDVNARGSASETALHCAFVDPDSFYSAKILLENGCDINAETVQGETALDIAIAEARKFFSLRRLGRKQKSDYEVLGFDSVFNDCCTSDEDYDYVPDQYPTVEVLKRHLVKLKVAGLFVSERNLYLLDRTTDKDGDGYFEISDVEKETEEEVNRMKKTKLNPEFSLYDVFLNSSNPAYAKNKSLKETLRSFNLDVFPIYGSLIKNNFMRSRLRLELLCSGQKSLDYLVKMSNKLNGTKSSVLPEELLEKIVLYLNNHELKCLIRCGDALKHQLYQ